MNFDIVINNGLYIDGSGADPIQRNIGIRNGKIAEISETALTGERMIDAAGRWVTPGFIEPHSHYDAEIIAAPALTESIRHGVTTVMTGICSISMICSEAEDCSDLFTRVEAVPREHVLPLLKEKKTWRSPKEFRQFFDGHPLGANLAAFVGHSDLRVAVMGLMRSVSTEKPSADEMQRMEALLNEALDSGFLGLSTMTTKLDRLDGDRAWAKPLPSTFATWKEYRALNRILRARGGILQSAPDAVGKVNIFAFFWEAMAWFRKQLKTTLLTVLDLKAQPYLYKMGPFGGWVARTFLRADFMWQFLPSPMTVYAYGLDFNSFGELADARVLRDFKDPDQPYEQVQDPEFRKTLRKNMDGLLTAGLWHRDFSDAWIVECPDQTIVGKNFAEVGKQFGKDPIDTFLDLCLEHRDKLRWGIQFGNHRPEVMRQLIRSKYVHVGFADSGAHLKNLASYNFPICLLKYVMDGEKVGDPVMPIGQAVRRLTGELADWFGLDAGYIRKGDRADVAIINPEGFTEEVWDMVDRPFPEFGMDRLVNRNDQAVDAVLVNGQIAYTKDGGYADDLGKSHGYGRFLAGQHVQPLKQSAGTPATAKP